MISFTSKTTWDETVQKIIYDTSNHSILQVTLLVTKTKKKKNTREKKKVKVIESLMTSTPFFHNKYISVELLMTVHPCH